MKIRDSYNAWAKTYDAMANKTRDLEAKILRETFPNPHYGNILELGSGTGKNTGWLSQKADLLTTFDFSPAMISKAREKLKSENIELIETDVRIGWPIKPGWANLIVCSLVLEHIRDLDFIFEEAARVLKPSGKFYICELHPFKQYTGSQARFDTATGVEKPEAFVHHLSDYLNSAKKQGFDLLEFGEHFDDRSKENIPRLVSLVFESGK